MNRERTFISVRARYFGLCRTADSTTCLADYEGAWCQRKKSEFRFEYKFLEDQVCWLFV